MWTFGLALFGAVIALGREAVDPAGNGGRRVGTVSIYGRMLGVDDVDGAGLGRVGVPFVPGAPGGCGQRFRAVREVEAASAGG